MNKLLRLILLSLLTLTLSTASAFAVSGSQVQLRASTVAAPPLDTIGQFDTTLPERLLFHAPNQPDLVIPYAQITEFFVHEEVARHLGVFPAIVVGTVKKRQQHHFVSITYTDATGAAQVATFEVAKSVPSLILPVLEARARNACERRNEQGFCSPIVPAQRVNNPNPLKPLNK